MKIPIKKLVEKYLTDNGFDGLFCPNTCACKLADLMPCGEDCFDEDCEAGYLAPCDCGDHDWHIQTDKVKP